MCDYSVVHNGHPKPPIGIVALLKHPDTGVQWVDLTHSKRLHLPFQAKPSKGVATISKIQGPQDLAMQRVAVIDAKMNMYREEPRGIHVPQVFSNTLAGLEAGRMAR